MKEMQVWNQQRLEGSTKRTHKMVQRSLDSGDHTTAALGLMGLISDCNTIRQGEEANMTLRFQPYIDALTNLIHEASRQLQIDCPIPLKDDYDSPSAKRRRLEISQQVSVRPTQEALLQAVHDETAPLSTALTSAEQRLLSTVIPESALLPDVAAMQDKYHPNIALYDVEQDRNWASSASCSVHLGFYTSTMLHEFVAHRDNMRRFSFVHLMHRMGFGAPDINFYVTYVDDTFFRRIYCDSRLSFLAESFSPRIRVYHGQNWASLWDIFLANRRRSDGISWTEMARSSFIADSLVKEFEAMDPQQLIPSTVLGALHRAFGVQMRPYDSWCVMQTMVSLESEFLDGIQRLRQGTLQSPLEALRTYVRAWPICLRSMAVEHVQVLVRSLSLIHTDIRLNVSM